MTTIKSIIPQVTLPIRLDRFVYEAGDDEITLEATTPLFEDQVIVHMNFSDLNTLLLRLDVETRDQIEESIAEILDSWKQVSVFEVVDVSHKPVYVFMPELLERASQCVELKKAS